MKSFIQTLFVLFLSQHSFSQHHNQGEPWVSTYSIVAYDSITGDMGVAVQSHWFSVGSIVLWGEAYPDRTASETGNISCFEESAGTDYETLGVGL
jgi:hypothetical protein